MNTQQWIKNVIWLSALVFLGSCQSLDGGRNTKQVDHAKPRNPVVHSSPEKLKRDLSNRPHYGRKYQKSLLMESDISSRGYRSTSGLTPGQRYNPNFNTESYNRIYENDFHSVAQKPLSTFSVDVDTAAYSNMRRFINQGTMPPKDAVRIEEMINYFQYNYKGPKGNVPVNANMEMANCPWNSKHKLVMIGLQAKKIDSEKVPPRNLVFLVDVSGSMYSYNKLPLLKKGMKLLVQQLRPQDKVAIVVYAGAAGQVLPSTSGEDKNKILAALDRLRAGGSTNGGAGIKLAYKIAQQNYIKGGINRVILASDGDFNVGVSSQGALVRLIEKKRESGVFLTVLGFGMGNYKDSTMEQLANKGNGNYAYIDSIHEARKVLVQQAGSTLVTVAKDVKIQIEFNPRYVKEYRLIGYENRMLKARDFNDDKKDAGEMGAGHTVTAIYEIVPSGVKSSLSGSVDPLKYSTKHTADNSSQEVLTCKVRYKQPDGKTSKLLQYVLYPNQQELKDASVNMRFAASVAGFGMILRGSKYKGSVNYNMVWNLAKNSLGTDPNGYRAEFLRLVRMAELLKKNQS